MKFSIKYLTQYHLNILSPAAKKIAPVATRINAGIAMKLNPAPSLKMLLTESVSIVKGSFWITGRLHSGKL